MLQKKQCIADPCRMYILRMLFLIPARKERKISRKEIGRQKIMKKESRCGI